MLDAHARRFTDRIVVPIARGLVRLGITPDALTLVGLLVVLGGAALAALGHLRLGAAVLACGLVVDAFDGAVARARGTAGPLGAFYDSVADRVSDAAVLSALLWLVRDEPRALAAGLAALALAQLTPYLRAKAEAVGWRATVGVMERAERLVVVLAGLVTGWVEAALWVLVAGGAVTVAQRVVVVRRQACRAADRQGEQR